MKKINFSKIIVISFLMVSTITGCSKKETETKLSIQIKGSDTMVNLGQSWAEEFAKLHPDVNIAVTGGGSGTGIAALLNGTCDIAESSRDVENKEINLAKEKGLALVKHIVGLDGLAVILHPSNPVSNLTIDELRAIFTGEITNWKVLKGKDSKIVILSREVNSGTHVFFKEHILRKGNPKGKEEFAAASLLMPSSQAIADEVAQNSDAIGYYGMGYISDRQKTIRIAKDKNSAYIEPTKENVLNNKYPISRPLYMFTNGEPKGIIKNFMDFALSEQGQIIVEKIDFVPVKQKK